MKEMTPSHAPEFFRVAFLLCLKRFSYAPALLPHIKSHVLKTLAGKALLFLIFLGGGLCLLYELGASVALTVLRLLRISLLLLVRCCLTLLLLMMFDMITDGGHVMTCELHFCGFPSFSFILKLDTLGSWNGDPEMGS